MFKRFQFRITPGAIPRAMVNLFPRDPAFHFVTLSPSPVIHSPEIIINLFHAYQHRRKGHQ